ncbi:MAG: light-harvesting antenna LH1, alpha subunit [Pseudomonadota bacterium]
MWRVWLMVDPLRSIVALHVFLAVLAFTIHFILLSTDRYNWLGTSGASSESSQLAPGLDDPTRRIG